MPPKQRTEPIRAAGFAVARTGNGEPRLLLLKNSFRGEWGFPKGHLEPGEAPYSAAVRELEEETGIARFRIVPGFEHVIRYALPSGKHKGLTKETVYYLAEALDDGVELSGEHDDARWCTLEESLELLTFDQLRVLAREAVIFLTRQVK